MHLLTYHTLKVDEYEGVSEVAKYLSEFRVPDRSYITDRWLRHGGGRIGQRPKRATRPEGAGRSGDRHSVLLTFETWPSIILRRWMHWAERMLPPLSY